MVAKTDALIELRKRLNAVPQIWLTYKDDDHRILVVEVNVGQIFQFNKGLLIELLGPRQAK